MKLTKLAGFAVALVVVLLTAFCESSKAPVTPAEPAGPDSGTTSGAYTFTTSSTSADKDSIEYVFVWADGWVDTTAYLADGATVSIEHAWSNAGTYTLKAMAIDESGRASAWSPSHEIVITGASNSAPATPPAPTGPNEGFVRTPYAFSDSTTEPEGDSIAYRFYWGSRNEISDWSEFVPSGTAVTMQHSWLRIGNFEIEVQAKDVEGHLSAWSPAWVFIIR